jgi:hypothetical protein
MNSNITLIENKIKVQKQKYGLVYGMVAGLAFAVSLWGYDGYVLSRVHAYFPWVKFMAGSLLTMAVGGLAGWLVSRFERTLLGILFWFAAAGALAWLTALVPIVITPALMGVLEPKLRSLLNYTIYDNLSTMVGVAFAWIVIAVFIIATIQLPLIEQAVFSTSVVGKIAPSLVCAILMLISGAITDSLNNQPLREPIANLDKTIQFSLNTRGKDVDPKAAREVHLASLRDVQNVVVESRRLIVSRYDQYLENVYVVVNFNGNWVECSTAFSHPLMCKSITP